MAIHVILDVEATDLLGEPFAVAAIAINDQGELVGQFAGTVPSMYPEANSWVKESIILKGKLDGLDEYDSFDELASAYFEFQSYYKLKAARFWADWGCPVESHFLRRVAKADEQARKFAMPCLEEVKTMVEEMYPMDGDRFHQARMSENGRHNPMKDCWASAKVLFHVLYGFMPNEQAISSAPGN